MHAFLRQREKKRILQNNKTLKTNFIKFQCCLEHLAKF